MNNKVRISRKVGWIVIFLFITVFIFSCKKDGATIAVISIVDANSAPVADATVTLWQDTAVNITNGVQSTLRVTKTSDVAGKAQFEFKLEAFLNIEVIKGIDTARSFVRLKEHETVTQTVNL